MFASIQLVSIVRSKLIPFNENRVMQTYYEHHYKQKLL